MQVYQTDRDGVFMGMVAADPDPMVQGNWLIPAGCVKTPPPAYSEGQFARWTGAEWRVETTPPPPPPPPEPTAADKLAMARNAATLDRAAFLKALRVNGVLPADEAIAAARGDWPASFAAALKGLQIDAADAQIDWAAAIEIRRMNPMFRALLAYYAKTKGMTMAKAEAFGDQIFGIAL